MGSPGRECLALSVAQEIIGVAKGHLSFFLLPAWPNHRLPPNVRNRWGNILGAPQRASACILHLRYVKSIRKYARAPHRTFVYIPHRKRVESKEIDQELHRGIPLTLVIHSVWNQWGNRLGATQELSSSPSLTSGISEEIEQKLHRGILLIFLSRSALN